MATPDDQQPQSPNLGAAVQLDNAETLDGPAGGADPLDAGYVPPDRPYVLDEDGVTGAGMRDGDTLDQRLRREQPEELPVDEDRAGRLVADGPDGEGTDVGVDGGAASAEEAAVHDVGDAEGPAETEPAVPVPADPEADAEVAAAAADQQAFTDATEDLDDLTGEDDLTGGGDLPGREEPTGRHALRDPADRSDRADPADPADRIDAARDAGGAAAPASGRDDVGPGSGL